ncbi:MAG: hypothetical protein Q4D87_01755 [Actinomycetaceae bacterium]|nr:hypothetical protein [Actinomycetaceae bacterium]
MTWVTSDLLHFRIAATFEAPCVRWDDSWVNDSKYPGGRAGDRSDRQAGRVQDGTGSTWPAGLSSKDANAPAEAVAKPRQIQVAEFDSVRQASMWRRHGAAEATRRLTAVLRTAILLGDELTIDRNQLLDGIYFLALGPQGIARELGLSPDSILPIKVKCQPEPATNEETPSRADRRVPALRGASAGGGDLINIDLQLEKVRSDDFLQASSARMATMAEATPNDWLCAPIGENWVRGAGLTNFATNLSVSRIEALIEEAQEAWAGAMLDGRVAVDRWDRGAKGAPLDVPGALRERFSDEEEPRPLARFVLAQNTNFRKEMTGRVYEWMTTPQARNGGGETTWHEARMAMDMWSRAYYRAIAEQDGAMFLSFYDNTFKTGNEALAAQYGLALPRRSRWERLRERLFTGRKQARAEDAGSSSANGSRRVIEVRKAETIRIEGEILDHMLVIAPPVFAQLYPLTRGAAHRLIQQGEQQAMFDVAYAAREAVREPETHAHRRFVTLMRVASMTVLAVVIALLGVAMDLTQMSRGGQVFSVAVAGILGVIAGLPWDDLAELMRLRGSAMTATLTVSNEGGQR